MCSMLHLAALANTILGQYFHNSGCMLMFSDGTGCYEYRGNAPVVNFNVGSSIEPDIIFRGYGCQDILMQHSRPAEIFFQLEEQMKMHKDRFNNRRYLIFPTEKGFTNATGIFNLPQMRYVTNIIVVIPEKPDVTACNSKFKVLCETNESYILVTNKYVGDNISASYVIDQWFSQNQSFKFYNNLFPDKIKNQQGRVLKCASFDYKPYSIIGPSSTIAKGSENSIANEYALFHNMTVEYITDDKEWGIIYDNWTGNGILGNVATDKADVGYGALYTWEHEYNFLDLSKPTVRTGITCLVPAPRLAAGWLMPMFPFSWQMWIATAITFMFVAIVVGFMHQFIEKQKDSIQRPSDNTRLYCVKVSGESFQSLLAIFLTQSLPTTSRLLQGTLRYMSMVFLFGVLLTASYSSGLSSVMTIPRYENAINTVFELAKSGLYWGGTQDAWIFSIMDEKKPPYVTLVNRFVATSQEALRQRAKALDFAFSIERLPSGHYAVGSYITEDTVKEMRLMDEDLYWEYCVFMLPKNSPLLNSLDSFIMRTFEAGLISFWEEKAAETHMDLRVQEIVKYYANAKHEQQETVQLRWVHVEGAFGILLVGWVAAAISFVCEICIPRRKQNFLASRFAFIK